MPLDPPNLLICYIFLVLAAADPLQCKHLEPPVLCSGEDVSFGGSGNFRSDLAVFCASGDLDFRQVHLETATTESMR